MSSNIVRILLPLVVFLPGCFFAIEGGVAKPVSGPVKSEFSTSVGLAVGFVADFGVGLIGLGTAVSSHEVTRDSGQKDELHVRGAHLRTDLTLAHDDEPIISGANFGTIVRATSSLSLGGCRKSDVGGLSEADGCEGNASSFGDAMRVSMGALAGIRTMDGDNLTLSLSPYYMRSKHATDPSVGLAGVMVRATISGVPTMFRGLGTLFEGYDYEQNRLDREAAAERNKRYGDTANCKGVVKKDSSGKSYCERTH